MTEQQPPPVGDLERERLSLLEQVHGALEGVMVFLSAAWIALLVAELVGDGLPPSLELAVWAIWAIFIIDFAIEFTIAPSKRGYLRGNWITVVSLVLPALRILRVAAALRALRAVRFVRTVGLIRVLTSVNRGLASLRATALRRGVPYVLAATALVMIVGAAGMTFFESPAALATERPVGAGARAMRDYGEAFWWTAYAMTTGAPHAPVTGEGKLLGWLLSLYGLGIFGYLTATLASHFIGRDREAGPRTPVSGVSPAGSPGVDPAHGA